MNSKPTADSPAVPRHCDIRGCTGVAEHRYVRLILDRPALVELCSIHRFENWTLVHQTNVADAGAASHPATAEGGPPDAGPRATISRVEWLRLEIEWAEEYIARFRDSNDPIEQGQVRRREREAAAFRAELAALELPRES